MKYYIVVDKLSITKAMIEESINALGTIRENSSGSKCILAFGYPHPNSASGLKKYLADEIITEVLTDAEWQGVSP